MSLPTVSRYLELEQNNLNLRHKMKCKNVKTYNKNGSILIDHVLDLDLDQHGVSSSEEESFKHRPSFRETPMLAEDISWIDLARNVREYNVSSSNGCTDKMKREHIVSFVQLRMELDAAVDNRLVITKDVTLLMQWNTQVGERRT